MAQGFADVFCLSVSQRLRGALKHFVALRQFHEPFGASAMSEPLTLSLGQKFELERMTRAIDATGDPQALRGLDKQLLQAWQSQKAATQWVMRQQLGAPSSFLGGMTTMPETSEPQGFDVL